MDLSMHHLRGTVIEDKRNRLFIVNDPDYEVVLSFAQKMVVQRTDLHRKTVDL